MSLWQRLAQFWGSKPAEERAQPLSPPKNHVLPEEALGRLIVILQRLGLAEAVPLALIQPVDVRHMVRQNLNLQQARKD